MRTSYKRILLKLSGESLAAGSGHGIDTTRLNQYASQIKAAAESGVEIAIVIGGGNIFRGLKGASQGFDRVKGDQNGYACYGYKLSCSQLCSRSDRAEIHCVYCYQHVSYRRALQQVESD